MRTLNLLFIILLLASCNKEKQQSARESEGLKGPVKKVARIDYDAINKFDEGEINRIKPKRYGSCIVVYDSTGNRVDEKNFNFDERKISGELVFNEKNQLIKSASYNEHEIIEYHNLYEYNDHGDQIKEIDLMDGDIDSCIIKYNDHGQKIYLKDPFRTITYKYDGNNLTEQAEKWAYSTDITKYSYDESNNLVEEKEYESGRLEQTFKYGYDAKGNLIKRLMIDKNGKMKCEFYEYDTFDRKTNIVTTNGEDYPDSDILEKTKIYYANDSLTKASRRQTWDEKGELVSDNQTIYFVNSGSITSEVSLDRDENIIAIALIDKKGIHEHATIYDIKSEMTRTIYNYVDGKLVAEINTDGNSITYEYEKGVLIKTVQDFYKSGGKIIAHYKNGNIYSITSYDKDNTVRWSETRSYKGNAKKGMVVSIHKNDEDEESIVQVSYAEGREVQRKTTAKGIIKVSNYTYNEYGDIIEVKSTDGNYAKHSYEYDSFGNWIRKISSFKGGELSITERAIEYF